MRNEAKANEDADKKLREQAEKTNMIDTLIFQTEKQMKEIGEKIPADKKAAIEASLADLKKAKESNDADAMDKAAEALNAAWQAASQDIYNATQQQQQDPTANAGGDTSAQQGGDTVSDVEYEEVKDNK
jgi:molecular chaperone DnaK